MTERNEARKPRKLARSRRRRHGQASIEYVMLLVVLVVVFFVVGRSLRDRIRSLLVNNIEPRIQRALTNPDTIHKFKL